MAEYIEETTPAGSGRAKAMRLINAHAIPWQLSDDLELYVTKAAILEMPAVDAVPVVHGRWVDAGRGIKACSNCNHGIKEHMACANHYCPNCGAKMDGGGDT